MRPNMRPTEKTDPKGALNDLSAYMRKSLGVVILALVLAALSAVLTIIGPDQVGKIATIMSDGLLGGIDLAAIARVGILLAVIYGLSALFGFIQHYIMASVTLKMSYRMRAELSEKINRVPQKYFNFHAQGDILSRITNDVSTLQQGPPQQTWSITESPTFRTTSSPESANMKRPVRVMHGSSVWIVPEREQNQFLPTSPTMVRRSPGCRTVLLLNVNVPSPSVMHQPIRSTWLAHTFCIDTPSS